MNNLNTVDVVPEKISLAGLALFIYIATLPLSIAKAGTASIYRYVILVVIAIFLLDYFIHKNRYYIYKRKVAPFTLYFFYTGLSVMWSVTFSGATNIFFGMLLIYCVYLFATSRVYSQKELTLVNIAWILASIVIIYLTIFNRVESGYERYTASFMGGTEDKNQIAGYYFMPLLICLNGASKNKKLYLPSCILLAAMIYSIMLAGSRGGLLSISLTIIVYYFFYSEANRKNKIISKVLSACLICVVLLLILYFIMPFIAETSIERFSLHAILDDGGSGRLENWAKLLNIYSKSTLRIIFGFGPNGTANYLDVGYAHNQIIQVLFDGGIIGLVLFGWFLVSSFKYAYKYNNRLAAFAFVGMFVLSMTITAYTAYKVYWNIIIMMNILHNDESLLS